LFMSREFTYYGMNNKHFASCGKSEAINYILFSLALFKKLI